MSDPPASRPAAPSQSLRRGNISATRLLQNGIRAGPVDGTAGADALVKKARTAPGYSALRIAAESLERVPLYNALGQVQPEQSRRGLAHVRQRLYYGTNQAEVILPPIRPRIKQAHEGTEAFTDPTLVPLSLLQIMQA